MSHPLLTMTTDGAVADIKIHRMPLDAEEWPFFVSDLRDAVERIDSDTRIRVVLLRGDSPEALDMPLDGFRDHGVSPGSTLPVSCMLDDLDRPIVAVFEGRVSGVGLELGLCCDVRIATPAAVFGMDHVRHGMIPWEGGTQRLTRIIGPAAALEMLLLAESVDAPEAYRIGLVHRLLSPAEDVDAYVKALVEKMIPNSPLSMAYAKEAIKSGIELPLAQGLRLEADLYFLMHTTDDRSEGIQAFLAKRPPKFQGK